PQSDDAPPQENAGRGQGVDWSGNAAGSQQPLSAPTSPGIANNDDGDSGRGAAPTTRDNDGGGVQSWSSGPSDSVAASNPKPAASAPSFTPDPTPVSDSRATSLGDT